jgi:hypothetical protein
MCAAAGCESPTDPDDTISVDDFVLASSIPDPVVAEPAVGKTYRVVRGNNQPDEFLEYDWRTTFTLTISVTDTALDDDIDVSFPVNVAGTTLKVNQASGGIATPPTGGDVEHYEFVITQATSNQFPAANAVVNLTFEVYYDLPNLRKEALIDVTLQLTDSSTTKKSFVKVATVRVGP